MTDEVTSMHLARLGIVYVRQSSPYQVMHNEESQRLQRAMEQKLHSLGWQTVEVIDDDQGVSAATAGRREGFDRMVAEVCLGKVGAVAAREVSRFARNSREWQQLIEMCSLTHTLLVDHDAIYDPRRPNDRLLLGLKGSISEYELDLLRQRSLEARRAKAARGELVVNLPVGFVKTPDGKIEKDPDQRVQHAIELVFQKFLEIGTARQTLMWLHEQGLEFPRRRFGAAGWETWWKAPAYDSLLRVLTDPVYGGAYAWGKTAAKVEVKDGVLQKIRFRRPPTQWAVLLRDHHEGYITWRQFEKVQQMLEDNVSSFEAGRSGAAKKGPALLAGLIRCRRCGMKLVVTYSGNPRIVPRYCCRRGFLDYADAKCISFGGLPIDQAIVQQVLRVVQPCAIEVAIAAADAQAAKQDDALNALLLELKGATYATDRAWRQYDSVDPTNRLVADELERRWNAALQRQRELEHRVDQAQERRDPPVSREQLGDLASDLERVWNAPQTDVRLKKRIVRTLIEEVVADVDPQASQVNLVVHWKGGLHTELAVTRRRRGQHGAQTSTDVIEAVRILARICQDKTIAGYLNRNGLLTGRGNRWTRGRVTALRNSQGIAVCDPSTRQAEGWMKLTDAAAYVGVSAVVVRQAIERGTRVGLHPLTDGPWLLNRRDLDAARSQGSLAAPRITPENHDPNQLNLRIFNT